MSPQNVIENQNEDPMKDAVTKYQKIDDKSEDKEEKTNNIEPVSFSQLFQFADAVDQKYLTIGICTALISGASQPANLILFGEVLNTLQTPGTDEDETTEKVNFIALMYLVIASQMFITQFTQTAAMSTAAGRQTRCLRESYFRSLLKQEVGWYDVRDQGSLATSVMESTLLIQDGIGEKLALAIQFTSSFFFGLIVALYYVWQLALLLMGVVPVLCFLIGGIANIMTNSAKASSEAYNSAGSTAQETLGSMRTVFAFGGTER